MGMAQILTKRGDVILLDDADCAVMASFRWSVGSGGYARRNKLLSDDADEGTTILLHRQLMGVKAGDSRIVDHINGNRLDNRRENLRLCNRAENTQNQKKRSTNKSGYKGVSFHKAVGKWEAVIYAAGKSYRLGFFSTPESAYEAYCNAAREIHGQFANLGIECR